MNAVQIQELKKIIKKAKPVKSFRKTVRHFKIAKSLLKNRKHMGTAAYSVIHLIASGKRMER